MPILKDCKIYLEGYDLSGFSNQLDLSRSVEVPDRSSFGDVNRRTMAGGLETIRFTGGGYADLDDGEIEEVLNDNLGVADAVLTVSPEAGAMSDVAYVMKSIVASYEQGGDVGIIYPFKFSASGQTRGVRGHILYPKTAISGAGTGTSREEGAISATQDGYGALHIFAISDGTLTVTINSDADDVWGGTSRIAFGGKTQVGGYWKTVAGAITDQYWRVEWTFSGTSATFAVGFGIK